MADLRVVIADDNSVVRSGLQQVLGAVGDIELVGVAANGQEAIDLVEELKPDVVLLDVRMPVMSGVEAARHISPHAAVVMLTHSEEHETIASAVQNGARGYVVYSELDVEYLSGALKSVAAGATLMSPTAMTAMMSHSPAAVTSVAEHDHVVETQPVRGNSPFGLSGREAQIMELIADGLPNKEIAQQLFLSEKTVKNHTNRIFSKMGVGSRAEAVSVWFRSQLDM
ncbi:response regulator transcription factor [Nesterenkonia rhizosphaerae]|uniref:Response regulator transcription factor n=1 Tax=Nesterenkonia rhizosphaerae TaxID=1348272 RepID=A0ABP9G0D2_9MICC